ncbi:MULTISPECIES: helix-turn-helix transcriptional regulator [unclassified Streptomyces]|uniref:helix-turn-helix transcriptional regulator n=1 Tax=unclassified Streptomyces TaxID=2593676 RepID=UPI0019066803|nr:LuxR family transcriptional regulator [Streptomyces sp. HSG2]
MSPDAGRPLRLRGRERQLAQVRAGLREVCAARSGRVLIMEAPAGAGKTRLLLEAVRIAEASGPRVIDAGAAAGVEGLGEPAAEAAIDAARRRMRGAPEDMRALVVLDDLHLAGPAALTALCDTVVALRSRPILWLLSCTPVGDPAGTRPAPTWPARLRGRLPVEAVGELEPLTGDALHDLVADCAGAPPGRDLLDLAESVDATPRAVIETVRGLVDDGVVRVVDGRARVFPDPAGGPVQAGEADVPARVPDRFARVVLRDLRSLSGPTLKGLRLAAVLGSPFAPEELSAMLGEGPGGLLAAVDEAVERRLLVCEERHLAFRTQPIWRVLLDSVPPPVCAMLRRQAAEALLSRPDGVARAALQLVRVARPGDTEDLRVIAEGSRRLLSGDPSTAAALASRCLELATESAERVRLARTAVDAFTRAGELTRAIAVARDTLDEVVRARDAGAGASARDVAALQASLSTASLLLGDAQQARRAARGALAAGEAGPPDHTAVVAQLATAYLTGDRPSAERARRILAAPDRHARAVRAGALTFRAFGQWREGHVGAALGTLREAAALGSGEERAGFLDPRWFLAFALTRTGEFEEAGEVVERVGGRGAEAGTLSSAVGAVLRGPLHLAEGRLDEAEASAGIGAGAGGPSVPMLAPQAWLVSAHVALRRGALTRAREHVRVLESDFPQPVSSPWWAARMLLSAQLSEALEDVRGASDVLARVAARPGALRLLLLEDPAAAAWCVRCARAARLEDLVREVVATAELLRHHNRRVPAVVAAATHARGLADGDPDALARADLLHRNPWAGAAAAEDRAAVLLDLGERDAAVAELDRALSAYGGLGGDRDSARVRARLRELGVRRRHWNHAKRPDSGWDSLTDTERRVAELVADGLTNQQTARRLFVSPHTVGFHLRQIYRKLGIRSRTALIRTRP